MNPYHVIHETLALECFVGSELQMTTLVCKDDDDDDDDDGDDDDIFI